ncbi:MAG TPA: bifunctional methylenetetrahydrofolate dehydrogenase/methenyltetrahydrofolate cyclohydrolase FolD [Alphaproteobacteria bacterium]|nr:bifunctional methylenetetrahydrofolate dehydrogenase/methenyltetrahydrofolate cyclohydrolase FolD [Alphaproteobacteria bacterium]
MSAALIDGKAVAADLQAKLAERVARLKARHGVVPGLAVVLAGEDAASDIYVRSKLRASDKVGLRSLEHRLPASTSAADILELLDRLNADEAVDGILVQLPLPSHIDPTPIVDAIHPDKDVDGFHIVNVGRLAAGRPGLVPCTPRACEILLHSVRADLTGAHAVIIGRSQLVGRPMAQLLLRADCTVTITHTRTRNLAELCREADVLIAAAGRAELVRGDWIKPGAIVIDVGINRIADAGGKGRIVGDVAFAEALPRAGAITPVPGGVGPMTVACLLENGFDAACRRRGLDPAAI